MCFPSFHKIYEKRCLHCWYDSIAKGFKSVHPTGSPISHSTNSGERVRGESWGEVWSLVEDCDPPFDIVWSWRPDRECK